MGHGVGHHIDISIHALREEGDTDGFSATINFAIFLSTPSVRRATAPLRVLPDPVGDFYPRPP